MKRLLTTALFVATLNIAAVTANNVWVADNGDGTYTNPILHADYSDPDVIRVKDDYYMISSSFNCVPGIPLLHSKDLVNWEIINHIYTKLPMDQYNRVAHGRGAWAPSIRFHDDKFYVYFCTPDDGLFMACSSDPRGEWELTHVLQVQQWEDPCPFWDDDGKAWLIRSKLCGGPVYLHRMSDDGKQLLDNGKIVYWDNEANPILEGVKMMKRNSYYYILAPAGGVVSGWQTVLRSKNIEGPYEAKKVLDEGNGINGPHQGGLIDTPNGDWWFIHFQDRGAFGRITHLQPAKWLENDWVVIGDDPDGDGCGVPVLTHKKPNVGKTYEIKTPQTTDEFESSKLGLQWQWQGSEQDNWYSLDAKKGSMRLYPIAAPSDRGNIYYSPNILLQKLPAPSFTATTKLDASGIEEGERAGLTVTGLQNSSLVVEKRDGKYKLVLYYAKFENCWFPPREDKVIDVSTSTLYLKVDVNPDLTCFYSYSEDGKNFTKIDHEAYEVPKGRWIGGKVGIYCINPDVYNGKGYVDFDYFRVEEKK
ncbi:MAG: glycoside hydrolase 43 family protein [Rikenellaceae bacterium]